MHKTINTTLIVTLLLAVSVLSYFVYQLKTQPLSTPTASSPSLPFVSSPESAPAACVTPDQLAQELAALSSSFNQSLATVSAAPASSAPLASQAPAKQTSFIAMGDTFSTTSMTWVDVPGSEVYIDLANDYSPDAYITFSASLKVAHANGQAFARLYDATNNIAVAASELSVLDTATFTQKTSPQLALWRGNNLYKVQAKSLNSFEVTVSGPKLKITY